MIFHKNGVERKVVKIEFDPSWQEDFFHRMDHDGPWANWDLFQLAVECRTASCHS